MNPFIWSGLGHLFHSCHPHPPKAPSWGAPEASWSREQHREGPQRWLLEGPASWGWEVRLTVLLVSPGPLWAQKTWGLWSGHAGLLPHHSLPLYPQARASPAPPALSWLRPSTVSKGQAGAQVSADPLRGGGVPTPLTARALQAPGFTSALRQSRAGGSTSERQPHFS